MSGSGGKGGAGGGALYIECDELYLSDGVLKSGWCSVVGQAGNSGSDDCGGGGGGGGGTLFIVCNRIIKGTDTPAVRQQYLCTQGSFAGGAGGSAPLTQDGGLGGTGYAVIIELDPTGRD
jgi:hypothetical protein